ncbi:hypothetical protein [Mesorhizobium sp. DCY119]|uniref:hypothetical protein n=1 Tax=Mesorhizobium sp. DCY119 TaxID=2108445 RepID=UPI000E6CC8A7|nr:hypothetical protein [Mesorhizobium sp. DCY119]RJG46524.1 hypothetical protein D3Y55_21255 [Mesorhizobium sp. DCY119]
MSNHGDQFMPCAECGKQAESDSVDVGVGLYIAGNYQCECGWEYGADGKARVGTYDDWFPVLVAEQQEDWVSIGYTDPPPAPEGFTTEVKRDCFLGIVTAYRYIRPLAA